MDLAWPHSSVHNQSMCGVIDLQARRECEGVDLPAAFAKLGALYSELDAQLAKQTRDLDLPCHRGCDACCHESVFLTRLEFYYVWDWAQRNLSDPVRTQVVTDALALYAANRAAMEALSEPPPEGEADHFSIARTLRYRCPFLDPGGACRVYPVRELLARVFGCTFNAQGGLYSCHLVAQHLSGRTVTLLSAEGTAARLRDLPLTARRHVYPFYLHELYG